MTSSTKRICWELRLRSSRKVLNGGDGVLVLKAGGDLDDFFAGGFEGACIFLDQGDLHPQGAEVEEAGFNLLGFDLTGQAGDVELDVVDV